MKIEEFAKMEEHAETHWWYLARRKLLKFGIEAYHRCGKTIRILDLASACGNNIIAGRKYGPTFGIDISANSIDYCKKKNISTIVQGNVEKLPFENQSFDIIVAFDVFEHVLRDYDCIREAVRVLKDGGYLLVNVPAFMALYSKHDQAYEHLRRYTKTGLNRKLEKCRLTVISGSYWSCFILPGVLLQRKVISNFRKSPVQSDFNIEPPQVFNMIFAALSKIENWLMTRRISFPFGVSYYCIARKEKQVGLVDNG